MTHRKPSARTSTRLRRGDPQGAAQYLGNGTPDEDFIDSNTRITSVNSTRNSDGSYKVAVDMHTSKGEYFETFTVAPTAERLANPGQNRDQALAAIAAQQLPDVLTDGELGGERRYERCGCEERELRLAHSREAYIEKNERGEHRNRAGEQPRDPKEARSADAMRSNSRAEARQNTGA